MPIYLDPDGTENAIPAWLVIGYAEPAEVGANEQLFSPDSRYWRELREGRAPANRWLLPQLAYRDNTRFMDAPYHRPRRNVRIRAALGQVDLSQTRRPTATYADELIDLFWQLGDAEMIAEYARPLPVPVLARPSGRVDPQSRPVCWMRSTRCRRAGRGPSRAISRSRQSCSALCRIDARLPGTTWRLGSSKRHPVWATRPCARTCGSC